MISFDTSDLDISAVEVNGTSVTVSAFVYLRKKQQPINLYSVRCKTKTPSDGVGASYTTPEELENRFFYIYKNHVQNHRRMHSTSMAGQRVCDKSYSQ